MSFFFTPGNALGCNVNSHRSAWNGKICTQPSSWACSAAQDFREKFCANGDARCYHLKLFDADDPYFVIDDNGAGWILNDNIHALDDQIMLLWGQEFVEPRGVRETGFIAYQLFGAYRVRTASKIMYSFRTLWRVDPYPDGFARFHQFKIPQPRFQPTGGAYIKQIERGVVKRLFDDAEIRAQDTAPGWFEESDARRFRHFRENLEPWLDTAKATAERNGVTGLENYSAPRTVITTGPATKSPFEVLRHIPLPEKGKAAPDRRATTRSIPVPVIEGVPKERPKTVRPPLVEAARGEWIAKTFGAETLKALLVASVTKPLVVLKGGPGVGKSHLAVRLLDDPKRERTLVVPVSATWRGKEDLLGYVNPVSNLFEPTRFTEFLITAAEAWNAGDHRTKAVVFEEFNLAQPEYWLSDVLVISQYADDADRVIHLGGESVRGKTGKESTSVFLSPAVRFVATMNNDHTTRPLSARVIDRAAVVDLALEPRTALAHAGLELSEDQILAIADLEFPLRPKGATFSMRSAISLKLCQDNIAELKLDLWQVIDLVLVQEVLSKVRLLARDPMDEAILQQVEKWSETWGRNLSRCSSLISVWRETLKSGCDVVQA